MSEASHEPFEDLPPPSPELILLASMNRAFLRQLPKKNRMAYLQDVTDELETLVRRGNVHRIRPVTDDRAFRKESVRAFHWWRLSIGHIISSMD